MAALVYRPPFGDVAERTFFRCRHAIIQMQRQAKRLPNTRAQQQLTSKIRQWDRQLEAVREADDVVLEQVTSAIEAEIQAWQKR